MFSRRFFLPASLLLVMILMSISEQSMEHERLRSTKDSGKS